MSETNLTILGAGPAGLASGFYARRAGFAYRIYEAGKTVGGNARTLSHGDFRYDTGAHRFHSRDPQATRDLLDLMGDELRRIDVPSQIVYEGRRIDFPLSPLNLLRNFGAANSVKACGSFLAQRLSRGPADESFEAAVVHRYGRTIAEAFLLGYTGKLWGVPPSRLSPRVSGKRLRGLNLRTFLIEAFGGARVKTQHLDGTFYYPRNGIGAIMEHFADACGRESIHTECRVTRLFATDDRIVEIEINGRERLPVSTVLSTLPLSILLRSLEPAPPRNILDLAAEIRFRHVILVALFIDRPRITPNASLYFPDRGCLFTRVYEPKNRSDQLAPPNKTSLIAEIPVSEDNPEWRCEDQLLIERCIAGLARSNLLNPESVFDGCVHRIPFAYPVLELGFERKIEALLDYLTRYRNLHVLGRNGEFAYTHIHDLMREGRETIDRLVRRQPQTAQPPPVAALN